MTDLILMPIARSRTLGLVGVFTLSCFTASATSSTSGTVSSAELDPSASDPVALPDDSLSLLGGSSPSSGFQLYALSIFHFFARPWLLIFFLTRISGSTGRSTANVLANGHAVLS